MGDLENPGQGEPQGEGQTSDAGKGTSTLPETLTRAEHEKFLSDSKAEWGRDLKAAKDEAATATSALAGVKSDYDGALAKLNDIQRRIDEKEEAEASASPEARTLYQQRKASRVQLDKADADLREANRIKLAGETALASAQTILLDNSIVTVAVKNHIDIEKFKAQVNSLGLTEAAKIEEFAKTFGGGKPAVIPPKGDSGQSSGGSSSDELKARYPTMF